MNRPGSASPAASWPVAGKVRPPELPPCHLERPTLLADLLRTDCSVVVLHASAGFGKTTLLADWFQREEQRNTLAAWLTVDQADTPETIERELAFAFSLAGLGDGGRSVDRASPLRSLLGQIEEDGRPCLLVLDELERLGTPGVDTLGFLVDHAPANLRLGLGMRRNPGLDLSALVIGGRGVEFGADWLRFSAADMRNHFGAGVSPRELRGLTELAEGWPIAVGFLRHLHAREPQRSGWRALHGGVASDWLEYRLLESLDARDRQFVLELSQFDWIDLEVVNEALGIDDCGPRIAALDALGGLLQHVPGSNRIRLHGLLAEYGKARLRRADPNRYRELHRAIGKAMSGRGHIALAVEHAYAACDAGLIGDILQTAGGLALFLRGGMSGLGQAMERVTDEVANLFPRLAMLRCRVLIHQHRLPEARALYHDTERRTRNFTRDRASPNASALASEARLVHALLIGYGSLPFDELLTEQLADNHLREKGRDDADPAVVAAHAGCAFVGYYVRGMFDQARPYGDEAETTYTRLESAHGLVHVNLNLGMAAMACGRTKEARQRYGRACRIAEPLTDRRMLQMATAMAVELDLECARMDRVRKLAPDIPFPFEGGAAWFDIIVAANEVAIAWRFETGGVDAALRALGTAYDHFESRGHVSVCRLLLGSRVGQLAAAGRIDEANSDWRNAGLPEDDEGIVRLDRQTWREMEALACARTRLLVGSGRIAEARNLVQNLAGVANERALVRTAVRSLALWMVLEHEAGNADGATARLMDYLRMFPDSEYSGPFVRDSRARGIVREILAGLPAEAETQHALDRLRGQIAAAGEARTWRPSGREQEIIRLLARGLRDKEIARELSLSVHGVRYHLRNIYRKAGASSRAEVVGWSLRHGIAEH